MARLSDKEREKILADFHTGSYSVREIAKRYNTSATTVSKLTKGLKPKHKEKVDAQVSIITSLADESLQEVDSVNKAVEERTRHLIFFKNSALKNQKMANDLLNEASALNEIEAHARITAKNKETVLGKDAQTQVNIQNNNAHVTQVKRVIVGIDDTDS